MRKSKLNCANSKMVTKFFLAILFATLLRNGLVTVSSSVSISSGEISNKFGSKDSMLNAGDQNDKKELVDRVKELEIRFQQHASESKAEREDQYEHIVILKAAKRAQEEKFKLVLNEIDGLKTQNRDQTARIVQLEEILKTQNDATSSIHSKPNIGDSRSIIPSSCEDLKLSGHHLNGIYIIFDANVKKVLATYCNFHPSSPSIIEKKVIGSLGINTLVGGVYFYAQMKTTFKEVGKIVPFDRIVVNQGNGLNLYNKGVFTAPRAGIYHFTFKGNTIFNTKLVTIALRHNGVTVGDTACPVGIFHVHATLKLKAGDQVYLFKGTAGDLFTDEFPDTHFSGWLLEEDVSIV